MDPYDLPSDSESNDSDYRPVNDSGSDSIDEKDELLVDQNGEEPSKVKKRRKKGKKANYEVVKDNVKQVPKSLVDPDEEKKRVDALWADFLGSTEIPIESKKAATSSSQDAAKTATTSKTTDIPKLKSTETPVSKIFEFAGETIEIKPEEKESSENSLKTAPINTLGLKRPGGGGLSSVLNQLSKKNKLSVLEKTKLDWDGFKSVEGISEELKTHNRGRDGFLERRDFLERTDLRQFEIEKNMRVTSKRSNK